MKTTTECGRCAAKLDIEEGLQIGRCLSTLGRGNKYQNATHELIVDPSTPAGAAIVRHIEKKPALH